MLVQKDKLKHLLCNVNEDFSHDSEQVSCNVEFSHGNDPLLHKHNGTHYFQAKNKNGKK